MLLILYLSLVCKRIELKSPSCSGFEESWKSWSPIPLTQNRLYRFLYLYPFASTGRVLACSHVFHPICIDPWLSKRRNACPVCKRKAWRRADGSKKALVQTVLKPGEAAVEVTAAVGEEDDEEEEEDGEFDDEEESSSGGVPEALRGLF